MQVAVGVVVENSGSVQPYIATSPSKYGAESIGSTNSPPFVGGIGGDPQAEQQYSIAHTALNTILEVLQSRLY